MTSKRIVSVVVFALLGLALGRAGMLRYQEKERALREQCRADLQKLGVTHAAAKLKYPTPYIGLVTGACLLPGGTAEVVVKGKFAPGTKFIFENDSVEVVSENVAAGEYRATVKVPPGTGAQTAALMAFTPVTCLTARAERAVTIAGQYEWTLEAANGWRIVARNTANKSCQASSGGENNYSVLFYRKGEANPFEQRKATLYHDQYSATNYRFSISEEDPEMNAGAEDMQALVQKMMDPKLTDAQRDQLMKRLEQVQQQMQAQIQKMTGAGYAQQQEAKRKQFGCRNVELAVAGGAAKGSLRCAAAVGTQVGLTGTVKLLGR